MPLLNPDEVHFPMNIINGLAGFVKTINPDTADSQGLRVFKRQLLETDGTESVGITPMTWNPIQDSLEIMGGSFEPTLQTYSIAIQAMVIDGDMERAIATFSILSSKLRRLLYGSSALDVGLRNLQVKYGDDGPIETVKKWTIPVQNFQGAEVDKRFILLSTLELVVETEIR